MKKSELTKHNILQTAAEIVVEKGYSTTTTKEIASATGVSEGTLFKYFKTKEQLLKEIIHEIIIPIKNNSENQVVPILLGTTMTSEEKLRFLYTNRKEFLKNYAVFVQIMLQEISVNPLVESLFNDEVLPMIYEIVSKLMAQGITSKEIKPLPVEVLTIGFIDQLLSPYLSNKLYTTITTMENRQDILFEIYLNGILITQSKGA